MTPGTRRRPSCVPVVFAILLVAGSLLGRIVVRGHYYPGWDVMLPAEGLFQASTRPPSDAVSMAFGRVGPWRCEALSVPLDSPLFSLLPGYLTHFWPWEFWGHTVGFLFVLASMLLTIPAAGLSLRRGWIVLLALGASPALLSFAVAGYPHAAGYFPHALALWLTLDRRMERHLVSTIALSLVACAVSWYSYAPAATVFLVFLGAALLRGDARWSARLVWLAVGALQLWAVLEWPGPGGGIVPSGFDPPKLGAAVVSVARSVFVTRYLDEPILFAAACLSFLFFGRDRMLVFGLWLAQLGFVVLLAAKGPELLCPRRFLLVECYCLLAVGRMYAEASGPPAPRRSLTIPLVALLVAGNVWQVAGLVEFARTPRPALGWPLPYTHAPIDFQAVRFGAEWADEMASRVEAGETLIVIYSLGFYGENATNPTELFGRMYLRLGHERFVDSVLAFGATPCLPNCLPLHRLSEIDDVLDRIRPGGPIEPSKVALYYTQDLFPTYLHTAEPESAAVFTAVRRRFSLEQQPTRDVRLMRFRLRPRPPDATEGFSVEAAVGLYEREHEGVREQRRFDWSGPPFEQYWVMDEPPAAPYLVRRPWAEAPFSMRRSARLVVSRAGTFDVIIGSNGQARLTVDDDVTATTPTNAPLWLAKRTLDLAPGSHRIDVQYPYPVGTAHLIFDVYRSADGGDVPVAATPASSP